MRRPTQHALLFLLGAALLRIAADDTYLRYVRPGHRWLLIGAGAVMVVLAVVAVVRDARAPAGGSADQHEHGHDHGAAERHAPWLLMAPVLVLALVAPPALGADAVTRAGDGAPAAAGAGGGSRMAPLPAGPQALSITELVTRAVWEPGSVDGREVVLVGFTVPRADRVQLARLSIACCAADARVSKVDLAGPGAAELAGVAADTWLQVRGSVQPGSVAKGDAVPTVVVDEVRAVAAPADPYEY